jgi:MFS family permease
LAWVFALVFYFLEYAVRSAPAVMIPELSGAFGVDGLGVSAILGVYYYTYSTTSLIAGVLLDRYGAKYVVPSGMAILGFGCMVFGLPHAWTGNVGRLMHGAGSAFAFTGAVYLASRGFSAQRLATAIGMTQCLGMLGGSLGQIVAGPLIHGTLSIWAFWTLLGVVVLLTGVVLLWLTPTEHPQVTVKGAASFLDPYKVVFSNPQSYLCGLVAGLLFVPTTVGDMIWGVRFFQADKLFSYQSAVFAASMVPLGWVFGCPLLGWLADSRHRRVVDAGLCTSADVSAQSASGMADAVCFRCCLGRSDDSLFDHQRGQSRQGQRKRHWRDQFFDIRRDCIHRPRILQTLW